MGQRDVERAYEYFKQALSVDPDNILALSDMADLLLVWKSKPYDAFAYAERAVSKSPPLYIPYVTMGNVLVVLGKEKEAEFFYRQAVERGMADYMVPFNKGRAYYIKNEPEKARDCISQLRLYKNLPEKIKEVIEKNNGRY